MTLKACTEDTEAVEQREETDEGGGVGAHTRMPIPRPGLAKYFRRVAIDVVHSDATARPGTSRHPQNSRICNMACGPCSCAGLLRQP